ncbi:hypothetical protein NKI61_20060 [Mesorhizobium sp. M0514]|uniref:hypothetical protein n=1 Tax=Mesorhizobium sp. M0514 TaxID=2956955 RepID=UPI00333B6356
MKNLGDLWQALLLSQTVEEQAAWAREHGLQLIEHACMLSAVGIGETELKLSPDEALAMHAHANPRNPRPFGQA